MLANVAADNRKNIVICTLRSADFLEFHFRWSGNSLTNTNLHCKMNKNLVFFWSQIRWTNNQLVKALNNIFLLVRMFEWNVHSFAIYYSSLFKAIETYKNRFIWWIVCNSSTEFWDSEIDHFGSGFFIKGSMAFIFILKWYGYKLRVVEAQAKLILVHTISCSKNISSLSLQ